MSSPWQRRVTVDLSIGAGFQPHHPELARCTTLQTAEPREGRSVGQPSSLPPSWDLVPQPEIKPRPPSMEEWSLDHWFDREAQRFDFLKDDFQDHTPLHSSYSPNLSSFEFATCHISLLFIFILYWSMVDLQC